MTGAPMGRGRGLPAGRGRGAPPMPAMGRGRGIPKMGGAQARMPPPRPAANTSNPIEAQKSDDLPTPTKS